MRAWSPYTLDALTICDSKGIRAASLAYREGFDDGRDAVLAALGDAGRDAARLARPTLVRPSLDELQRRQEVDHSPCPRKCRQCSRCIHSLAYWSRGGRDYCGVQAEANLAKKGRVA